MTLTNVLKDKYPAAYEDDHGTIWTSREAAGKADWTYENGDAFLEEVLGWSWAEAEENFALSEQDTRRKEFWKRHPHLRETYWFILRRYRFTSMFLRTVWRDYYGRISWSTAWELSRDLWLR